jgi:hypothetical protein
MPCLDFDGNVSSVSGFTSFQFVPIDPTFCPSDRLATGSWLNLNPKSSSALPEGYLTTFKNFANVLTDHWIFKAPALVREFRQEPWAMRTALRDDNLVRVSVYYEIRIVGDDNYLSPGFGSPKLLHKVIVD